MNGTGKLSSLVATTVLASAASADAVFNIWVDAPSEVLAGETFTVGVWAEVSGSILDTSDGGFHEFLMDLLAIGVEAEFSTATIPFINLPADFGTPGLNALRSVAAGNYPYAFNFADENPLLLFTTEVTTAPDVRGSMEMTVSPVDGAPGMLSWWVDYGILADILDTDPGSSRIITPATVNVIPAPATLGLLALGLLARRRRS